MASDPSCYIGPVSALREIIQAMASELSNSANVTELSLTVRSVQGKTVVCFEARTSSGDAEVQLPIQEVLSGGLLNAMGGFRSAIGVAQDLKV